MHTTTPGALIHVISRFVDGRFVLNDEDRERYLLFLGARLREVDWSLLSYALMSSHIHLALLAGQVAFSEWAHVVHTRFAMSISSKRRQSLPKTLGQVFGDRPSTYSLPLERTAWTIGYHHRNPVDAGLVSCPADSRWTSHRAYLGLSRPRAGLDVPLGLQLAGFPDSDEGRQSFHRFVCETTGPTSRLPAKNLLVGPKKVLGPQQIVAWVVTILGETKSALEGPRTRRVTLLRRVVLSVGRRMGYSMSELAPHIRISPSGASRLMNRNYNAVLVAQHADRALQGMFGSASSVVKTPTSSTPSL